MKRILQIISIIGLILTIVPSYLVFTGVMELGANKTWMFVGTALWFITAPFWMNKKESIIGSTQAHR